MGFDFDDLEDLEGQAEEQSKEQAVAVAPASVGGADAVTSTLPGADDGSAFALYMKATRVATVANPWPEEAAELFDQAVAAAQKDAELSSGARLALELMCRSAACSPEARMLASGSDDAAFGALLLLARKTTGSPAADLIAVRERQCTGKLYPRWNRPQIGFVCEDYGVGTTICANCFLEEHAGHNWLEGMSGMWSSFVCPCAASLDKPRKGSSESQDFVQLARSVAEGRIEGLAAKPPADWPRHRTRLLAHLGEMHALHASSDGKPLPVNLLKIGALRDLHLPWPAVKLKNYSDGTENPKRLVLLLHGAMATEKHLNFMYSGIFGGSSTSDLAILGIEADFWHDLGLLMGNAEMVGFSYERPTACLSRHGEFVCETVRIYKQVLENWLDRHPTCKSVDLVGFSAGALVAWLLFCMIPQRGDGLSVKTLSFLSPRVEEHILIADNIAKGLLNNRLHVFLGYGEEEDRPADGAPFSALAASFGRWMPARQTPGLRVKAYAKQGHVMTFPLLKDVQTFLHEAWQRKS